MIANLTISFYLTFGEESGIFKSIADDFFGDGKRTRHFRTQIPEDREIAKSHVLWCLGVDFLQLALWLFYLIVRFSPNSSGTLI